MFTDNLLAHRADGIRRAIKARTAELVYLPPYSPDLDPIEQFFARLEAVARAVSILCAAIGALPESFEPDEHTGCFHHAGHGST